MHETLADAMARVKATASLADYCDAHLEARGRGFYVCPVCGSGNHAQGSAAFHIIPGGERWKCHSCGATGDIFDLAGAICETDDTAGQLEAVASWAGVDGWDHGDRGTAYGWGDTATTDGRVPEGRVSQPGGETEPSPSREAQTGSRVVEADQETADYTGFYEQAHADLMASPEALGYLHSRGLTDETIERHMLGYVASWTHPKDGRHHTKRIIMPRTAATYTARAFDEKERDYSPGYKKQVVGSQRDLFNLEAARGADVVVCVEGELDAASITQATGYAAVGLGSITNVGTFAERAKEVAPGATWLISLDNDKPKEDGRNPGREAQDKLLASMAEAGLQCAAIDGGELYGEHKDANETLVAEPDRLKRTLDAIVSGLKEQAWKERMAHYDVADTLETMMGLYDLKEGRAPIATGLRTLDNVLGGGLHAKSLHIIGAQSSEGKTTLTLQVADHIAASGHPVLFCTIEQRADELMAKSLARSMYVNNGGRPLLTARQITNPRARQEWGASEWTAFRRACEEYNERVTPFMAFMDPDEPPTVGRIWEAAELMAERYGEAPVVIVDYLQICAPEKGHERDSDKQVTDKNVTLLRRLAGRLNTPVWVVASLNRTSYTAPISTDSFKESGAIEYGADVLLGLEPFDLSTRWHNETDKKKAILAKSLHDKTRRATRRWMDLCVLKNRFGSLPDDGLAFVYDASADVFETMWKVRREKRADAGDMEPSGGVATPDREEDEGLVL